MIGVGHVQHGDRARRAGGQARTPGFHIRVGLAGLGIDEEVFVRAHGRAFAAVIDVHFAGRGVVVDHEGPAANAGALRLHKAEHGLHRDGGVHGVPAGAQGGEAGLHSIRIGRRDHAAHGGGGFGRLRRRRGGRLGFRRRIAARKGEGGGGGEQGDTGHAILSQPSKAGSRLGR